ncbi:Uncharacterised protein [Mycobacteroides abscessus subsp. abscessus]|nr:Uncharacterised protein [Mycobacteroides abscessus subsp. abscessus]
MRLWRSPSAARIADCLAPSAARICACLAPSAVLICDSRVPSAVRIIARFSRSAFICFSIDSWMEGGGSMALSSTRATRRPQRPVASSRTPRSWLLIWSREVSVSSSVIPPTTLRRVVTVSCSTAAM